MDQTEEYISDKGNYSRISSTSGLSGYDDEFSDFRGLQPATDSEKQKLLLYNHHKQSPEFLLCSIDNLNAQAQFEEDETHPHQFNGTRILHKLQYDNASENDEKLRILQTVNQDIISDNEQLQKENDDFKHQIFQYQRKNKLLKQDVYQLNGDKECKESCIIHLKDKIKEQQAEIQMVLQQNFKYNIELSNSQNELITTKGTLEWYKAQWHDVNTEKNHLQQESLELKNTLRSKKLEISRLESLLHDLKQEQLKTISFSKSELSEKSIKIQQFPVIEIISNNESNNSSEYYLSEIEALSREINTVKATLTKQTELLRVLVKEKCEILQNHTVLQKKYDANHQYLQTQISEKQSVYKTNAKLMVAIGLKDQHYLELKTQITNVTLELAASHKEKHLVQESINKTRNNFHKLLSMQEELKLEIKQKDSMILNLEKKMQDNFMHESWNKCANEELVSKEAGYLKKIQDLNERITDLKRDICSKVDDKVKLMFELDEIKKYCKGVTQYNETLTKEAEKCRVDANDGYKQVESLTNERNEMWKVGSLHTQHVQNLRQLCSKYGIDANVNINEIVHNIESYILQKSQKRECNCKHLINEIEERCVNVAKKCSKAEELTAKLREEILILRDKIHVKEMDLCNKQKRYELYYRTLLKKVKEQKHEIHSVIKENVNLKKQQHIILENMSTLELKLCQEQITIENANCKLVKKETEIIHELRAIIKDLKSEVKEKNARVTDLQGKQEELCHKYNELVSTHSNCSRDNIETDVGNLQQKFDFYQNEIKIDNCTLNTNAHHIVKLDNDTKNALTLISALVQKNSQYSKLVQVLINEKAFLQRLIIDLKAALNASTCKSKINGSNIDVASLDLSQFSCPLLADEAKIMQLLQGRINHPVFGNIKDGLSELKQEVSKIYHHFKNIHA